MLIEQDLKFPFKSSNDQAEYEALVAGMLLAKELGARSLLVKSDSLLLNQVVFMFSRIQILLRMLKPLLCLMLLCWFKLCSGVVYML